MIEPLDDGTDRAALIKMLWECGVSDRVRAGELNRVVGRLVLDRCGDVADKIIEAGFRRDA